MRAPGVISTSTVVVRTEDGRTVRGSHCLLAIGSVPNSEELGLEEAGIAPKAIRYLQLAGEQAVRAGGFDFPELVSRTVGTIKQVQPDGEVGLVLAGPPRPVEHRDAQPGGLSGKVA